jgi:ribosome-associated toxin RatA of RatAB toxin-antitoxin module
VTPFLISAAMALSGSDDARLVRGDVVLSVTRADDDAPGQVDAWIDIPAPPSLVWSTMNDCDGAPKFVPDLVSCRIVSRDPGGAWDIREHLANPGWLLPNVRSRFRADYEPERQIRFAQIEGDFDIMQGQWTLAPIAGGAQTRLRYEARLKPAFWVPGFAIRHIIEVDAPETLKALRAEVMRRHGEIPARPE